MPVIFIDQAEWNGYLFSQDKSRWTQWAMRINLKTMRTPKSSYVVPIAVTCVSRAAEAWATSEPWYQKVPFTMIFWVSLAFLAGLIVQDLYNSNSWIWKNLRYLGRLAEVNSNGLVSWPNTEDRAFYFSIVGEISEEMAITVRYDGKFSGRHVGWIEKGEIKSLFLYIEAARPDELKRGIDFMLWGIEPNQIIKIEIELKGGLRRQTERFRARIMQPMPGCRQEFLILKEGNDD